MPITPTEPSVSHEDTKKVAEVTIEPRWMSEIARVLMEHDDVWGDLNFNAALRRVSQAVNILEREDRVTVAEFDYNGFGGQVEGSPRDFSGDLNHPDSGVYGEGGMWRPYKIVRNIKTPLASVEVIDRDIIDSSITIEEKAGIADVLSDIGNETAQNSEAIVQDHVTVPFPFDEFDYEEHSHYQSPGLDSYIEFEGNGYAIEISTRYVNPVDRTYVSHKINEALDKEEDRDVPIDTIIMAPEFTGSVESRYGDSDIVHIAEIPFGVGDGNPVIVSDDPDIQEQAQGSALVGEDYPVVDDTYTEFIGNLDDSLREYTVIEELEYRRMVSTIVEEIIQS